VQLLAGDFNGDGKSDVALIGGPGWATIPVASSDGTGGYSVTNCAVEHMNHWLSSGSARAMVGDFNGDGKDDIALVGGNGWATVPVAFAESGGCFRVTNTRVNNFPGWSETPNVQSVAGDFDGDGRDDIAAIGHSGWATLPTSFSNGDGSFRVTNSRLGGHFNAWSASSGARVLAGDFNGDGKSDVALIGGPGWGSIPVATSVGDGSYTITNCGVASMNQWLTGGGAQTVVGDFDGDGKDDIALVGGNGWATVPVAFAQTGGCFRVTNTRVNNFPSWTASTNVQAVAGDFDGDGRADIAAIGNSGWATLPTAFSNGDGGFRVTNQRL